VEPEQGGVQEPVPDLPQEEARTESEFLADEPDEFPVEPEDRPPVEAEDDVLGVAEARAKLLAAVAALEPATPQLSEEEAEALALAEAIENERRLLDD